MPVGGGIVQKCLKIYIFKNIHEEEIEAEEEHQLFVFVSCC